MGAEDGGALRDARTPIPLAAPELNLLDGFELRVSGRTVTLPTPAQRVLAVLALNGRPLARPYVAGLLWPAATKERSMASLRSALRPCAVSLVRKSRTHLRLGEHVIVDYQLSLAAAKAALSGQLAHDAVAPALSLLSGDLLPELSDDWIESFRRARHQLRLDALEALADRLLSDARPDLAARAAMSAVAAEPLRESAHLRLMRALLAEGNRAQALWHYRGLCDVLLAELGVAPSFRFSDALGT